MQPVATEGPPLNLASKSEPSSETLEPVPLGESHKRHVGGISVEESRDLMREADLIDRKVERQRIKSKHKEQRRKVKKRRREEQVIINIFCWCHCWEKKVIAALVSGSLSFPEG